MLAEILQLYSIAFADHPFFRRNALKRASEESADEGHDAKKAKGEELAAGPSRTPLVNRLRVRDSRPPGKH